MAVHHGDSDLLHGGEAEQRRRYDKLSRCALHLSGHGTDAPGEQGHAGTGNWRDGGAQGGGALSCGRAGHGLLRPEQSLRCRP
ncbi:MAG: hypothetical protein MZV64_00295 [Ignavibacteriales bacterium]|nr:hypothetical protein [Ignavibacteriales bacterium]